ncbi:carbohydrate ABC transporter permease [Ruminococcaceae bacterium OttesenSCG-928-A16]|nr:carbohydrate ABC transporter permease [Ruminococcaceae bacterium OttesenSCG-928-A16]
MVMLCIVTIVFVFPFYWVITGSFKEQRVTIQLPPQWFPQNPTLDNYLTLFKQPALKWFLNSFLVAFISMALVCFVSTLAGYVLAKKRFYGGKLLFGIFVAAMALPKQVVLVPLVRLVSAWGFHNTLAAAILPAVGWPFGVFLMKQFSETIPTEMLEAAKIDGCNEWQIFYRVVLPMVKPGIGALAIFTFISAWNDYFMQLIMLSSRENLTLQLGIATMQAEFATNYGVLMAGATFSAIPIVLIFIIFQKSFTQGITMGSVKG